MDGVTIALQAPEEAEGEDADGEADERHHDADPSDDSQQQVVHYVFTLEKIKDRGQITRYVCKKKERFTCFSVSSVKNV